MGLGTITPTRIDFDQAVESVRDDLEQDYSGWYCIRTEPWACSAVGCDAVLDFVTAAHLIVVWPSADDRELLQIANDAQRLGRNPRVEEYRPDFGPCISFDAWLHIGRPVHSERERPSDVPFRSF